jgi:hypothetical protein
MPLLLGVVHHRLARREDALAVRVAGRVGQVADHVLLDFLGGIEAEHGQVADVSLMIFWPSSSICAPRP